MCLNHEVLVVQPSTGTSPDLGFVAYCYVAIVISPTPPFPSAAQFTPEGATNSRPLYLSITACPITTLDHTPPLGVPCLHSSILRLLRTTPHGFSCSPDHCPSPSTFTASRHHYLPDSDASSFTQPTPHLPDSCCHTLAAQTYFLT